MEDNLKINNLIKFIEEKNKLIFFYTFKIKLKVDPTEFFKPKFKKVTFYRFLNPEYPNIEWIYTLEQLRDIYNSWIIVQKNKERINNEKRLWK